MLACLVCVFPALQLWLPEATCLGTPGRGCLCRWLIFSDKKPQPFTVTRHLRVCEITLKGSGPWTLMGVGSESQGSDLASISLRACLGLRAPIRAPGQQDSKMLRLLAPTTPALGTVTTVGLCLGGYV